VNLTNVLLLNLIMYNFY